MINFLVHEAGIVHTRTAGISEGDIEVWDFGILNHLF